MWVYVYVFISMGMIVNMCKDSAEKLYVFACVCAYMFMSICMQMTTCIIKLMDVLIIYLISTYVHEIVFSKGYTPLFTF